MNLKNSKMILLLAAVFALNLILQNLAFAEASVAPSSTPICACDPAAVKMKVRGCGDPAKDSSRYKLDSSDCAGSAGSCTGKCSWKCNAAPRGETWVDAGKTDCGATKPKESTTTNTSTLGKF